MKVNSIVELELSLDSCSSVHPDIPLVPGGNTEEVRLGFDELRN